MNNFTNNIVDNDKMFCVYSSELEGRLDPFYYQPSIRELEKKVRKQSSKKLRDYVSKISSGATPSVKEEEKYYIDKENGIPFLRVQNLQTNGKINLENVKYINQETHEKLLKRSQVAEHDLLVKITGVGRMAIASVAPDNFVGNTNQHMVVIKTDNKQASKYLSSYLNLDFVEKLASRRTTGGTRPALDYPALKSIPIIENIDFSKIVEAEKQKTIKEKEAEELLESIDDYLLGELGISISERDSSLETRVFHIDFNEISGNRFDPRYYSSFFREFYKFSGCKYEIESIKTISQKVNSGSTPKAGGDDYTSAEFGVPFIRVTNLKNNTIDFTDCLYINKEIHEKTLKRTQLKENDILISMAGTIGLSIVVPMIDEANINQAIARIEPKKGVNSIYVSEIINSQIGKIQTDRLSRPSVQANINFDEIKSIKIPLPPFEKQTEIALHIKNIRDKAKDIQEEANNILNQAKIDLQNSLLNK